MENRTKKYITFRKKALGEIVRLRTFLKKMSDDFADQERCWASLEDDDNARFWGGLKAEIDLSIYPSNNPNP